ncbi:hypothetical protein VTH06DRAFT_1932 [Thermothelomyces fergusii]
MLAAPAPPEADCLRSLGPGVLLSRGGSSGGGVRWDMDRSLS